MTTSNYPKDSVAQDRHPNRISYGLDESVCVRIVQGVASQSGVSATALPPLEHAIECDALETLFTRRMGTRPRKGIHAVTFEYADHLVRVEQGTISFEHLPESRD